MNSKEYKTKIWNLISDIGTGMLTTENNGELQSRPMQLVQKEYDGTIWFFTNLDSLKIKERFTNKAVNISFSCPENKTYVSLRGTANINQDPNIIDKFWNSFVSAWFPKGKDSSSCGLLEIEIKHGQYWESDLNSLQYLFEVGKSKLTDTTPATNDSIVSEKF